MKFKDKLYSYELLPEYADGSKRLPTVKAMNWTGKVATARVIRGFANSKHSCCSKMSKPEKHFSIGNYAEVGAGAGER
jgi:hypothetical protein